jgi:hypothetical protein
MRDLVQFTGDRTSAPDPTWARQVCLLGHGLLACKYLVMGERGLSCEKLTPVRRQIDELANAGLVVGLSDNCTGRASQ